MKPSKLLIVFCVFGFLSLIGINMYASLYTGIIGMTKKNGETFGCGCHNLDPSDSTSVSILGPSQVEALDTATFMVKIVNDGLGGGGTNIATQFGSVITSPADTSLDRRTNDTLLQSNYELTHKYPKLRSGTDTITFTFRYIAPAIIGLVDTIFANGNAVNDDTTSSWDAWNWAPNKTVTVVPPVSVENNSQIVKNFRLEQNYPNPFNPVTKISFNLYKASDVSLILFDVNGRAISTLIDNKFYRPGESSYTLDAGKLNLTSGIYFYKLAVNGASEIKKMVLVK